PHAVARGESLEDLGPAARREACLHRLFHRLAVGPHHEHMSAAIVVTKHAAARHRHRLGSLRHHAADAAGHSGKQLRPSLRGGHREHALEPGIAGHGQEWPERHRHVGIGIPDRLDPAGQAGREQVQVLLLE
ncbi:MAG: hypothetical protein ACK55I_51305, partial [bacterium]